MSKFIKKAHDPAGIFSGGGGGSKNPKKFTGSKRHQFVEEAKKEFGDAAVPNLGSGGDWASYVDKVQSGGFQSPPPPPPPPPAFEMPSFEFPDYSELFARPTGAEPPAAKTVAERLREEAEQFGRVKAGERVFSAAQGVSTRLRAAGPRDEEEGGGGSLGASAGTILGRRGTGGATSFRRKRISRY